MLFIHASKTDSISNANALLAMPAHFPKVISDDRLKLSSLQMGPEVNTRVLTESNEA